MTGRSIRASQSLKSVDYETVGNAICHILELGPSCYLGKMDIKSAFRIIPILPSQYKLLGAQIAGMYYYDTVLAMGCGSSCQIFEEFSRALVWILKHKFGVARVIHMINDFLFIEPIRQKCEYAMEVFRILAQHIGVPLSPEKTVGPARRLTFLGFEHNSISRHFFT